VTAISVLDPRFKTADGLGIGSTLGQIRTRHVVRPLVGEGTIVGHVKDLQMSFDFGSRWYPSTRLPNTARVRSVVVLSPVPPGLMR
jgi:hypothetical protein